MLQFPRKVCFLLQGYYLGGTKNRNFIMEAIRHEKSYFNIFNNKPVTMMFILVELNNFRISWWLSFLQMFGAETIKCECTLTAVKESCIHEVNPAASIDLRLREF